MRGRLVTETHHDSEQTGAGIKARAGGLVLLLGSSACRRGGTLHFTCSTAVRTAHRAGGGNWRL